MQFLQPILLWGMLGISIPVLIHLWRGRKGKVMSWAAMHWLPAQESTTAKGFRLENLLVLILRIIILGLLVLLLGKVFIPFLNQNVDEKVVHLVQPDKLIADEFRFELRQALENDEEVYWANGDLTAITAEIMDPGRIDFDLQAALDQIPQEAGKLILYLDNSQKALGYGFYKSPVKPQLMLGSADLEKVNIERFGFPVDLFFQVNEEGLFDAISGGTDGKTRLINEDQFSYYLADIEGSEAGTIKASLEAITEVFGFEFHEVDSGEQATLFFGHAQPEDNAASKLYFISTDFSYSTGKNLMLFSDELDFEHAEAVQTGHLPEVILEKFLEFSGIEKKDAYWSMSQLSRKFLVEGKNGQEKKANLNLLLLGLLVLFLGLERYFANRQGV